MDKEELQIGSIVFLTETENEKKRYRISILDYPYIQLIDAENNTTETKFKEIKLVLLDTKILVELGFIELENNYFTKDTFVIYRYGTANQEPDRFGLPFVSIYDYGFRIIKNEQNVPIDLDTFLKNSVAIPYLHNLQNYFQQNNINLNIKL
jgi:hypothetical protein